MSESTPLTCFQCFKSFPNFLELSRHMHIHQQHFRTLTEDKSNCLAQGYNMDLSQLSSLMSKSCLYQTQKPFKCKKCCKCFADDKGLLEHISKQKETKHICQHCGKDFHYSSSLSQHMRIHLGIKPFQCEICQSKFTQLGNLQRHERMHTGEKPYKCLAPGCNRAFSYQTCLVLHSRRYHQKDKPYRCKSCYEGFDDEAGLLQHIPNHKVSNRIKIHICQFCGKSYQLETFLSNHMNKKHAERLVKRPLSVNLPSDKKSLGRSDDSYWKSSYVHLTSSPTHHIYPHVSELCLSTSLKHVDPRGSHQLQSELSGQLPQSVRSSEPPANQQEPVQSTTAVCFGDRLMMLRLPQPASQENQPDGLRGDQAELPI